MEEMYGLQEVRMYSIYILSFFFFYSRKTTGDSRSSGQSLDG